MQVPRDLVGYRRAFARLEHGSRCLRLERERRFLWSSITRAQMLERRNVVGGPSTTGAVWGSTEIALPGSQLAHSRS